MNPPAADLRVSRKTESRYPIRIPAKPPPPEAVPAWSSSRPKMPTEFLLLHSAALEQTSPGHPHSRKVPHDQPLRPSDAPSDRAPLPAASRYCRHTASARSSLSRPGEAQTAYASSSRAQKYVARCTDRSSLRTHAPPALPE